MVVDPRIIRLGNFAVPLENESFHTVNMESILSFLLIVCALGVWLPSMCSQIT